MFDDVLVVVVKCVVFADVLVVLVKCVVFADVLVVVFVEDGASGGGG